MNRKDILSHKDEIIEWINQGMPKVRIASLLHCKESTLNNYLIQMGIVYKGQQNWIKNKELVSYEEYISRGGVDSRAIKAKLIREKIKKYHCERCGVTEWLGEPITLELHHKDGNHNNTELDNLELLCPNCHSQTKNFRKTHESIAPKPAKYFCPTCGNPVSHKNLHCRNCAGRYRMIKLYGNDRPTRQELKDDIRSMSFVKIGRKYNVSDNAIRKWCKDYSLPSTKKQIAKLSDQQWLKI